MSAIRGNGYGEAHAWRNVFSPAVGSAPAFCKFTRYECRDCCAVFNHYYDIDTDIFDAMRKSNVPETCFSLQFYLDKRTQELKASESWLSAMFIGTEENHVSTN